MSQLGHSRPSQPALPTVLCAFALKAPQWKRASKPDAAEFRCGSKSVALFKRPPPVDVRCVPLATEIGWEPSEAGLASEACRPFQAGRGLGIGII
jgi:hypothetical protein